MKDYFGRWMGTKFVKFIKVLLWCLYIIITLILWLIIYYVLRAIEIISKNKETKPVLYAEKKLEDLRDSTTRLSIYFIAS